MGWRARARPPPPGTGTPGPRARSGTAVARQWPCLAVTATLTAATTIVEAAAAASVNFGTYEVSQPNNSTNICCNSFLTTTFLNNDKPHYVRHDATVDG